MIMDALKSFDFAKTVKMRICRGTVHRNCKFFFDFRKILCVDDTEPGPTLTLFVLAGFWTRFPTLS